MKTIEKLKFTVTVGLVVGLLTFGIVGLVEAQGLVKVAILDTGSNVAYKEGISFVDGTVRDYNGHGTLTAMIVKEIYPDAQLYIIKVIGNEGLAINEEAIILGLEWAIERGVDIINMSLRLKSSEKLHRVIKKAYDRGIVIVAAAGNRDSIHQTPNLEVAYPAKYEEVIAVGALDRNGKVCDGSAKGKGVEIFCKGYKREKAGTSIASAYAAGLAAKIISENPNADLQELRIIMRKATQKRGKSG